MYVWSQCAATRGSGWYVCVYIYITYIYVSYLALDYHNLHMYVCLCIHTCVMCGLGFRVYVYLCIHTCVMYV